MKYIIFINDAGRKLGETIQSELPEFTLISQKEVLASDFSSIEAIVFIGALGICVRMIAPMVADKYTDPAVVCVWIVWAVMPYQCFPVTSEEQTACVKRWHISSVRDL